MRRYFALSCAAVLASCAAPPRLSCFNRRRADADLVYRHHPIIYLTRGNCGIVRAV